MTAVRFGCCDGDLEGLGAFVLGLDPLCGSRGAGLRGAGFWKIFDL